MARVSKFTEEQKLRIALDLLGGELSHAEICRQYDISSTYAYKLKDRALDVLREGVGRPVGRGDAKTEQLAKRVADLEQLAGDQALAIQYPERTRGHE
jgi:transposase-like protein